MHTWAGPQITYIIYLEYHSVRPFVRIGNPQPLPRKRVCPSPGTKGGGHTGLQVRGLGGGSQFGRLEQKPSTLSTLWAGHTYLAYYGCVLFLISFVGRVRPVSTFVSVYIGIPKAVSTNFVHLCKESVQSKYCMWNNLFQHNFSC